MMEENLKTPDALLAEWERRNLLNLRAHNLAERYYDRQNVSWAVISFGSLVVLGASATSFNLTSGNSRLAGIGLSLLAAFGSALQAIRGYGGLAEAHRSTARRYAALSRDIERSCLESSAEVPPDFERLQRRWDGIAESAPNVPNRIRDRAKVRPITSRFVNPPM